MTLHLGDTAEKSTQEELQFEYLKNWISSVHNREVAENVTCPFKSLALGISEAFREVEEHFVRSTLIESYRKLTGPALEALLCEKLKQETSFFHMTKFRDVEEVRRHWNWYLYCLTFESWQFEQEDLENHPHYVVRVPMDYIDLQVLATCFRAKITVSHLDSLALCFTPRSSQLAMQLHLVHHRSRWAPMLGRKAAVPALENQLVILQGLEGSGFQSFKNKPAYVLPKPRNFPPEVYLVNVGAQCLPMQRHQLHVIDGIGPAASDSWPGLDRSRGPAIGQAPSFRGIPDGSVEFQLLLELVEDLIYKRLRGKRDELLGQEADYERRGPEHAFEQLAALPDWVSQATPQAMPNGAGAAVPAAAPATPRVTPDRKFVVERRPLDEVVAVMQAKETNRIRVRCPSTYSNNSADWRKYFTIDCKKGMHIVLTKANNHPLFRFIFRGAKDGEEDQKDKRSWFASDLLCLWEVQQQMTVPSVTGTSVELQAGTALNVKSLDIQEHSAEMMEWKKEGRGGLKLNLRDQRLRPVLCIAQGDLSPVLPRNGDASVEV